jgi:predicted XRE-type DNA-binding protein
VFVASVEKRIRRENLHQRKKMGLLSLWGPSVSGRNKGGSGVVWMGLVFVSRPYMSDLMRYNMHAPSSHIFLFFS